ncbi:MAG: hypothetical protein JWM87_241 [Candidatus Eremiobacteraeota bacterium]|nr:hypothetical protein [Candidatus Eremiobacteraeota bacterium]
MTPTVLDDPRRAAVLAQEGVNGLDHVELERDGRTLRLTFLKPVDEDSLRPVNVLVTGGEIPERIRVFDVDIAERSSDVRVTLQRSGDRSAYTVHLVDERDAARPPEGYDVVLSHATFRFITPESAPQAAIDCERPPIALVEEAPLPEIDYLAKDYASFRRLMIERLSLLVPDWQERNPADLGIMLVELLAYAGDYLSYEQDAIATEAYLSTARRRTSVRRHVRLIDYDVGEGANARALVHVDVRATEPAFTLARGTQFVTASRGDADAKVFESMHDVRLRGSLAGPFAVYAWGARDFSLAAGATSAALTGRIEGLHAGDLLLLHVRPGDAPDIYHPVRLTTIEHAGDPIGGAFAPKPRHGPAALTIITWHADDALPAEFPVARTDDDGEDVVYRSGLTTVLANNVVADHGMTVDDELGRATASRFRPLLPRRPLVFAQPFDASSAARALEPAEPAAAYVRVSSDGDAGTTVWTVQPDLLESDRLATDFVVEVENDGSATLRFGDGEFGRIAEPGALYRATYRIGGGIAGNVGERSIAGLALPDERIERAYNPLPATGGAAPETLEHVREHAPDAYREQRRAVTADDYAVLAAAHADVLDAAAEMRRTGGWETVFVTVDRRGGAQVDAPFRAAMLAYLDGFRLVGAELEVRGAREVSLHAGVDVRLRAGYRAPDVRFAVESALAAFFTPDAFAMGDPVYVSAVVGAAAAVEGVASASVVALERLDRAGPPLPADGVLKLARYEKARVANDPRFPDRGSIAVRVTGS